MSPRRDSLKASVGAATALVRRRALLALVSAGASALLVLLLWAWAVGSAWRRPTPLPLLLDLVVLGGAGVAVLYWRGRLGRRLGRAQVAASAEQRLGLDWGSLRGVLELDDQIPAGTSAALARRAERALHERTREHSIHELAGELGERWQRRLKAGGLAAGAAALALAVLAFRAPERTAAGWAPLLHPVRQLSRAPLPALVVEPGDAKVARGQALAVSVRAAGREGVTLKWRPQGDVVHQQLLVVRGDTASGRVGPVVSRGSYWVEAPDGAVSPEYTLQPVDGLLLTQLDVEVIYPAYLARPTDRYEGEIPPLEVPAGTTLKLSGRATRQLSAAALHGPRAQVALKVSGARFGGSWVPRESGQYGWWLRDAEGAGPAETPPPLEIAIIADQAPAVTITFPGIDTILPADLRQAVTADAQDDNAVLRAELVSWRVRASGGEDATVTLPLPLSERAERVLLSGVLDASARALGPGDTLKYFVRVGDAAQSGTSATYSLRVPTAEELRARARSEARAAVAQAEKLGERTAELQRRTRNTDRSTHAANARRGSRGSGSEAGQQGSPELSFDETEDARRVLSEQMKVLEEVDQLRSALAGMRESMAAAGLRDEELQRRMEELQQLLERLSPPELKRELEALQQALQQLDPAELEQVLERLAREQQEMKEQLDRTLALMREAAAAQELAALSQEAKELATQQRALAEAHAQQRTAPDTRAAEKQEELAEKVDSLRQQVREVEQELRAQQSEGAAEQAKSAEARASAAQDSMSRAAASAAANQGERAAQQGRAAAEQLEQAAESLDEARQAAAEQRDQQGTESLQQATRDALALAQQQQELQQQMEQGRQPRGGDQDARPGNQQQSSNRDGRQSAQQQGSQQGGQKPEQGGGQQPGDAQGAGEGGKRGGGTAGEPGQELAQLRALQAAVKQGLEQLGRNLSEAGQESGAVNREVGAALNRANTSMQQTQRALEQAQDPAQLPAEQAAQTVDALNRLAISLLQNAQQMGAVSGGGLEQAQQQLADAAQQQGSINGQSNALLSLSLSPGAQGDQVRRLGREQLELARRLGGMNDMLGGREDAAGQVDLLAREAQALARELEGGRLAPEVVARQQRLFHRLLDAGRSLEQEETSDERTAERPGQVTGGTPAGVPRGLFDAGPRYRAPTPEELKLLPPAYRRLILEYFERLNRPQPPTPGAGR